MSTGILRVDVVRTGTVRMVTMSTDILRGGSVSKSALRVYIVSTGAVWVIAMSTGSLRGAKLVDIF